MWRLGKSLGATRINGAHDRYFLCGMLLAVLCLPTGLSAAIDLRLSESSCYPGDIVCLEAQQVATELATFELNIPAQDKLHLVAHQREPLDFHDGQYHQKDVWIFQTKTAGTIHLDGIKAVIRKGAVQSEETLPALSLEVLAYDLATAPSDAPLALPTSTEESSSSIIVGLIALTALALISGIVWWIRRSQGQEPQEANPVSQHTKLHNILTDLHAGKVPVEQIERLLADPETTVSPPTRAAMEQAVYGNGLSKAVLLTLIEQEVRA